MGNIIKPWGPIKNRFKKGVENCFILGPWAPQGINLGPRCPWGNKNRAWPAQGLVPKRFFPEEPTIFVHMFKHIF